MIFNLWVILGHMGHIQVCLSVTQVLTVRVKSQTDPPSDFKDRRIFPSQPEFWVGFFKTTHFKRFGFSRYCYKDLILHGKKPLTGEE